jgi:hypothetical protein
MVNSLQEGEYLSAITNKDIAMIRAAIRRLIVRISTFTAHLVLEGGSLEGGSLRGRSIKDGHAYTKVAFHRAAFTREKAGIPSIVAHLVFRWSEAERAGRNNDS